MVVVVVVGYIGEREGDGGGWGGGVGAVVGGGCCSFLFSVVWRPPHATPCRANHTPQ